MRSIRIVLEIRKLSMFDIEFSRDFGFFEFLLNLSLKKVDNLLETKKLRTVTNDVVDELIIAVEHTAALMF
jgi:hypothetical protein